MSQPHEPTLDMCGDTHCHSHNVDEPADKAYRICFECNHVYRTARELRKAYRRGLAESSTAYWLSNEFGIRPRAWRLGLAVRASRVAFCQECLHDF